ncbi:L,D-transpeptidase family protein [Psychrobacter sp. DM4]|uniref:L,D-transpeptidase family protein n=1 Tax=Psychrobacter sp. DM4 TaxID=3440637 RepID=UPI003F4FAE2C
MTNKRVTSLLITIRTQTLALYSNDAIIKQYAISTGKNGIGSRQDSGCTPLGQHIIAQKIGGNEPSHAVFIGRVPTGEIYNASLGAQFPKRDWILSRILWLSGLEEGINKGCNDQGGCDTFDRYIYIHGTPDSEPMGAPYSHGCIRMRNDEIIELFELVQEGTPVTIVES